MSNSTSSSSSGRIDDNKFYKMDHKHRGYLVIVDNYEFDNPGKLRSLDGHEHDVKNYKETFGEKLGFEIKLYENQTKSEMIALMNKYAKLDYTDHDCFMVVFLSHGGINDKNEQIVYSRDGKKVLLKKELADLLIATESLNGKLKIIDADVCRGRKKEPANAKSENNQFETLIEDFKG